MEKKKDKIVKEPKTLSKKLDEIIEDIAVEKMSKEDRKEILGDVEEIMKVIQSSKAN